MGPQWPPVLPPGSNPSQGVGPAVVSSPAAPAGVLRLQGFLALLQWILIPIL